VLSNALSGDTKCKYLPDNAIGRCANYWKKLVGRDGIEPPTPGFSVLARTPADAISGNALQTSQPVMRLTLVCILVNSREVSAQFPHNAKRAGGAASAQLTNATPQDSLKGALGPALRLCTTFRDARDDYTTLRGRPSHTWRRSPECSESRDRRDESW